MYFLSYRTVNFGAAVGCGLMTLYAVLYLQNYLGLEPCYLCITQRVFVIACGIIFALAAVHNPTGRVRQVYAIAASLSAMAGAYFASKQVWLQSLSEDLVPSCGPPVDYLFDTFSTPEVMTMLMRGDGQCAEIQWQFLGLSIPAWVWLSCVGYLGIALFQLLRKDSVLRA